MQVEDVMQVPMQLQGLSPELNATLKRLVIALASQEGDWSVAISCSYGPGYLRFNNYHKPWRQHEEVGVLPPDAAGQGESATVLTSLLALQALGYIEFTYEPDAFFVRFTNRAIFEMGGEV